MLRLTALAMIFSMLGGCSFALVSGPPANHRQLPAFECTTSRVGPIIDTVWTVLQTLNLFPAVMRDEEAWQDQFDGDPPFSRNTAIGVYGGFAALGAAGMWYGYSRVADCHEARNELAIRAARQPTPGPGSPEWWPPPQPAPAEPPAAPSPPAPVPPPPPVP
jgi:hypothetical protein